MNIVADQGVKHPSFYLGWEQRPCQFEDLELFFGPDEDEAAELPAARKAREERARAVCLGCSVRLRCLAWVLQRPGTIPPELRPAVGHRIYGCDDCQESCPPTVRLGRRHRVPLAPGARAWVDVLELLAADDATLLERHGHWYIAGRDPRWLRRNALVVLGNCADPHDRRVADTLARYRRDDDSMLAEHAEWASARLGLVTTTRS